MKEFFIGLSIGLIGGLFAMAEPLSDAITYWTLIA